VGFDSIRAVTFDGHELMFVESIVRKKKRVKSAQDNVLALRPGVKGHRDQMFTVGPSSFNPMHEPSEILERIRRLRHIDSFGPENKKKSN
jgi:hypothetical protein